MRIRQRRQRGACFDEALDALGNTESMEETRRGNSRQRSKNGAHFVEQIRARLEQRRFNAQRHGADKTLSCKQRRHWASSENNNMVDDTVTNGQRRRQKHLVARSQKQGHERRAVEFGKQLLPHVSQTVAVQAVESLCQNVGYQENNKIQHVATERSRKASATYHARPSAR